MARYQKLTPKEKRNLRRLDLPKVPFLAIFGFLSFILFRVLNRTSVSGKHHVPHGTGIILACRHQSLIDSFVVTIASMHFEDLFLPWNLPWHTPDALNYMKNPVFKAWGWTMKCLGIKRTKSGRRVDRGNLQQLACMVQYSRVFVFPAGTRERPGAEVRPQAGIGHAAFHTGATIVPIWIDGMDKVLPIGCNWPRLFKRIRIVFGPPVQYRDLVDAADPDDPRYAIKAIAHRTTEAIYALSERPDTNPPIRELPPPPTQTATS